MRTRYMPWNLLLEELKKVPPEKPFTLGLSDDGGVRVGITRISAKERYPISSPHV
jgi:hypothetical protein